ncbi:MAG: 30S ribosomal protein S1 [Candidatus Zambryskibacteria bacterium CG11_big_fil_rev_8_21_14_0_20_40_24]|uniref:30S ribosomal protein S1 n=1 Tax=Candidatus Zambryskibacteria bacterium CG11_big_fil_rev_8_21_14_0_20_40_24 TaxID=1975116 RepID=A0A2H0K953_9BACT|nr:MAG: 30S ribosomal protein S1 [Candidatus Zambryskibacteria bacterium CG11_big_fil_rev_8_21_14_0_20_40_24]
MYPLSWRKSLTAKRETLRKTMFGIKKNKSSVTKDDTEKDNESLENKETKEDVSEELEEEKISKKESLMGRLLSETPTPPEIDDIIEGKVLGIEKSSVYIDLPPFGTGIIYGREYLNARDIIRKINIGDTVAGKVVSLDNKDGYIEISLKEARQALLWSEAEDAIRDKTVFELTVQDANKGGLIIGWQGIQGFLPASQLKPEHYPRVDDGDKEKILGELRKLVDQKIAVSIISAIPKEGKLIFSEKDREQKDRTEMVDKFSLGDELVGEITGIVDFGIFVKIEEELEGLVHISEIDWGLVENPRTMFKVGDKVKVKIIEIKDGKISLSIKALKENPWVEASKKYKKDDIVKGVVIKFNKHGALASIEEGVAGLIHISEFGSEDKLREKLELGKTYDFKITLFDPKEQKMALTHTITEKQ